MAAFPGTANLPAGHAGVGSVFRELAEGTEFLVALFQKICGGQFFKLSDGREDGVFQGGCSRDVAVVGSAEGLGDDAVDDA